MKFNIGKTCKRINIVICKKLGMCFQITGHILDLYTGITLNQGTLSLILLFDLDQN